MNHHPGKNISFAFSKVAATEEFRRFYILSHRLGFPIRHVLFILDTNWPQNVVDVGSVMSGSS
jgi:hypothetical protein